MSFTFEWDGSKPRSVEDGYKVSNSCKIYLYKTGNCEELEPESDGGEDSEEGSEDGVEKVVEKVLVNV